MVAVSACSRGAGLVEGSSESEEDPLGPGEGRAPEAGRVGVEVEPDGSAAGAGDPEAECAGAGGARAADAAGAGNPEAGRAGGGVWAGDPRWIGGGSSGSIVAGAGFSRAPVWLTREEANGNVLSSNTTWREVMTRREARSRQRYPLCSRGMPRRTQRTARGASLWGMVA